MKKFYRSSAATLAATAFASVAFASASHADSVVTVNSDGSVLNVKAPQGYAAPQQQPNAYEAQSNHNLEMAANSYDDPAKRRWRTHPYPSVEEEGEVQEAPKTKKELALYPKGEVKVINGKSCWVSPDGDITIIGDNNNVIIGQPGYGYGRRYPRYYYQGGIIRIHSLFGLGYVLYSTRTPGYWHRVPIGDVIGGYPRYGYPNYGYPGYGYPSYSSYGYPGYGYYGSTTTFDGPGSLTSTYKSTTNGGVGVSIGRRGVGVSLRSGTTTTSRSTITADVAPGSRITTSTMTPYPYGAYPSANFGTPRVGGFGGTTGGTFGTNGQTGSMTGNPNFPARMPLPSPVMVSPHIR